jgi:hypothetical protein
MESIFNLLEYVSEALDDGGPLRHPSDLHPPADNVKGVA